MDKQKNFSKMSLEEALQKVSELELQLDCANREATRAAKEASALKSKFLANMSHEIRTPMNAIKGLAELLALTKLDAIQDNYVRNIIKSSNSLLSIINDMLDFSKINENKIEFVEGPYLLADLIAEVSNVVSLRAAEKGLLLLIEASPLLPKGLIGDDVRVKQVILNILNNAVKYTPQGHVVLRLFGEKTKSGFELVCSVEDTGIGIKEEDIPFLFEAFTQADRKVNRHIQGTGLGLSISDRLIRAMGGKIEVKSQCGKGSIFTARFPQRINNGQPLAALPNPQEKQVLLLERGERMACTAHMLDELGVMYKPVMNEEGLADFCPAPYTHCIYDDSFSENCIHQIKEQMPGCVFAALKDMRFAMGQSGLCDTVLFLPLLITELAKALTFEKRGQEDAAKNIDDFALVNTHVLAVDDNEINLIVSGEILRAYKAEVTFAQSGQEALDLCAKTKFDLIFMDHMMPGMDGIETTVAIREGNTLNKNTPIIALTANVVSDMASVYIKSGMNDFISKPIELDKLHEVLLKWLPANKITTIEVSLDPQKMPAPSQATPESATNAMQRLVESLDTFGMYASDVMREIENDYSIYISRMDKITTDLAPLVTRLRNEVRGENWSDFAADIGKLGAMIHDVGARDCSGRARKLATAARENNADYIKGDFFSLMDNMYMLEKKMEVALPLALGNLGTEVPFGDIGYCYDRLMDMKGAIISQDYETCAALLDSLAHYSLDHALDLILVGIRARLDERNFSEAAELHAEAVEHCAQFVKR